MNRQQRPRRRNNNRNRNRRSLQDRGRDVFISTMPRPYTEIPWNNVLLHIPSATTVTVATVASSVRTQLKLPATGALSFRFLSVKTYGDLTTGTAAPAPVHLQSNNLIVASATGSTLPQYISTLTRYPDQVNRASLSYVWPIAHQEVQFDSDTDTTAVVFKSSASLCFLALLWRYSS
jgi:hypothetical protein